MAFYNTGARYLFALGREGVLPAALGTHAPEAARARRRVDDRHRDRRRSTCSAFTIMRPEHRGARCSSSAPGRRCSACSASSPCRALVLGRDHPLLPDRGARRLPLVQDAGRAADRLPRDGRRLLAADRQPRRPVRAPADARLHQDPPVGRARDLRRRAWLLAARTCAAAPRTATTASANSSSSDSHARRPPRRQDPGMSTPSTDPTVATASHPLEPLTRATRSPPRRDPQAQRKGLGADRAVRLRHAARAAKAALAWRPAATRCRARRTSSSTSGASARPTRPWSR